MNTLTVKMPSQLAETLDQLCAREHVTRSELVRRAIESYLRAQTEGESRGGLLDRAGDLVGCFEGGPKDLASNPKHLAGFGRD
ncbi:hypothetical protein BURK2_00355 [Burkholderiales bacterium]|jgi:predicted transcriptional regulator|nr:MAG: CopG family transcriptional regulator [Burkholderiales bacterium]CAG0953962.1 hypothetical protein BURK2_00355 [Burkholderiales bacterium]